MPRPANPTLRNDILRVALHLLDEKGAARFTMREIAKQLGYSATAIYQHFASRGDLLLALKLHVADMLAAEMEKARTYPTTEKQLGAMAHCYLLFGLENPPAYRLLFQSVIPELTMSDGQVERLQRSWVLVREALGVWIQAQGVHEVDIDREALAAWGLVHGITSLAIAERLPFHSREEVVALLDTSLRRWGEGITAKQPSPGHVAGKKKRARRLSVRRRSTDRRAKAKGHG
jgi:AcrR family transcriptional regulator